MLHIKPRTFEDALNLTKKTILKLAHSLEFSSPYLDKDDLISCGMLGLFQCWKNFRDNETTKFTTFAYFRIKGSMIDEIRKNQIHKRNFIDKVKKIESGEVENHKNKDNILYMASYKNVSTSQNEVKDMNHTKPLKKLITEENTVKIKVALNQLESDEKEVLNYRYHKELKLREVGKVLNLSEARIHQIQRSALDKLKEILDEEIIVA